MDEGAPLVRDWVDVNIFCKSLKTWMDPFECVETDDGYICDKPAKVICLKCVACTQERKMMPIVKQRQETGNKRLKQCSILVQFYRHDIVDQRNIYAAIPGITQLAISNGEPVLSVEYNH